MGLKHLTVVCEVARVQVPSLVARVGGDTSRVFKSILCPSFTKVEKGTCLKWGVSPLAW